MYYIHSLHGASDMRRTLVDGQPVRSFAEPAHSPHYTRSTRHHAQGYPIPLTYLGCEGAVHGGLLLVILALENAASVVFIGQLVGDCAAGQEGLLACHLGQLSGVRHCVTNVSPGWV